LRGVGAELEGGLIGGLAKVREQVADPFLAAVDDLAGRSGVHSTRHILTKLLEAAAQLMQESVGREGRFRGRGPVLSARGNVLPARLLQSSFSRSVGTPERFATPQSRAGRGRL
jgi:hypothetical protein